MKPVFLYIQSNKDWDYENKYKYGISTNPNLRLTNSHDQHSHKSFYINIYECYITDNYKLFKDIDKIISIAGKNKEFINYIESSYDISLNYLTNIHKYLVYDDGGIEFIYKDGLELLNNILIYEYPKLGVKVKKINKEDLSKFNTYIYINHNPEDLLLLEHLKIKAEFKKMEMLSLCYNEPTIILRDYQKIIVDFISNIFKEKSKLYLNLATGAGKTIIAFSIISKIKPKTIIILTPRINICEQNIHKKYLSVLNHNYNIYDIHKNDKIDKNNYNLICCCIQSFKKLYDIIKEKELENIFIWFDEAHWGIDKWIEDITNINYTIKHFFLTDEKTIKYKLFTSASPDKDFINNYNGIFGDLYSPIKVKTLIDDKWLCNINVHTYKNYNLNNFILTTFKNLNKKLGLSFNNDCETALQRFKVHYDLYKYNLTDIKPYLLLNNYYISKIFNNNNNIDFDKSFTNIDDYNNSINNIGYVVHKYSIGYDNKNIDMLIFRDPKSSNKDIIQCIGRCTRSDQESNDGKNKNKISTIILPENRINNSSSNKILSYLLDDLQLNIEFI